MSNLPNKIPRNLLAEVFNNNSRMIKSFEDVLKQINDSIPQDLSSINTSITTIQGNITSINTSIATIQANITTINSDIVTLQTNLANLIASLGTMAYQDANNVAITGGSAIIDTLVINDADFVSTNVTLNNYAGASAGTLTNAPSAGNPTKWILINDNSVLLKIPAWT